MEEGIEKKIDYLFVKDQFYKKLIRAEQMANVVILMELEKEYFEDHGFDITKLKNCYKKEKDKGLYHMIVDGSAYGCNNFRAMAGYRRDALDFNPNPTILVHRMGDKLDFDLVNNLGTPQEQTDGSSFVKRKYKRAQYMGKIRYHKLDPIKKN